MVIFVDTSAIYALLSAGDVNHGAAKAQWLRWVDSSIKFVVTNYILLETSALVQRRLGMRSFRQFHDLLLPTMSVFWISEKIHRQAVQMLLAADRRELSLVDCTSFVVMNELSIQMAFTFDRHFVQAGFVVVPTL